MCFYIDTDIHIHIENGWEGVLFYLHFISWLVGWLAGWLAILFNFVLIFGWRLVKGHVLFVSYP